MRWHSLSQLLWQRKGQEQQPFSSQVVNVLLLIIVLLHIAACGVISSSSFHALIYVGNRIKGAWRLCCWVEMNEQRSGSWASSKLPKGSVLLPFPFSCIPLDLGAVLVPENTEYTLKPQRYFLCCQAIQSKSSCSLVWLWFSIKWEK